MSYWVIKDSHGCYWGGRCWYERLHNAAMFPSESIARELANQLEVAPEWFQEKTASPGGEEFLVVKVRSGQS